jgi:hypothetical protein
MKTVQGDLVFAEIAPVAGVIALVLLILHLIVPTTTKRKLFCWVRGGHRFEPNAISQGRIFHGDRAIYRTHICTRRYCGIQRDIPITTSP